MGPERRAFLLHCGEEFGKNLPRSRGNIMSRFLQLSLAGVALTAAMPAQAADFIFDTTTGGKNFTYSSIASNGEKLNVKISAYSRGLDNVVSAATLRPFAQGLGIEQNRETTGGNYHQIDNVNGWEFLVLEFDKSVTLLGDRVNAFKLSDRSYIDADQFVGWDTLGSAWNANDAQSTWTKVTAGLTGSTNTTSSPTLASGADYKQVDTAFNLTGASGNVWLIGAAIGANALDPDSRNDAFKLAGFAARTVTAVPEPSTWATMLVGFGMVGAAARYRRRRTSAVIA
jgi:hypothetical protein